VFPFHKTFSGAEQVAWADRGCRAASIGCLECKGVMADNVFRRMEPFRERRVEIAARPDRVREVLQDGAARARRIAGETMREVRGAMRLSLPGAGA
jgi:tryptophanyl-tRNA synthetase